MPIGLIYSNNPVIPQFGLSVGGFIFFYFFVPGYPITAQILALHSSFGFKSKMKRQGKTSGYF